MKSYFIKYNCYVRFPAKKYDLWFRFCEFETWNQFCMWSGVELWIGTRESKDSRVQAGLASPSPALKGLVDSLEQARTSSIGLASPQVPASPREASPQVQKGGLVPALIWGTEYTYFSDILVTFQSFEICACLSKLPLV